MKNFFIVLFLLSIYTKYSSQTKAETYQYLNDKIDMYKLDDSEKNYNYILQEVDIEQKKVINFIQFCTKFKLCSTAYFLNINEYTEISVKEKAESKSIEIFFKSNSIETLQIDINTEEDFKGYSASQITIILGNDTPQSEVNKIKNAFVDPLRIYDVEKKNTFD